MKKIMVFLTGVMAVSVLATMPCAAETAGGKPGPDKKNWAEQREKMNKELGLTPEQQDKMKKFHEENRPKMAALREKLKTSREALRLALDADTFDKGRVEQLSTEVNAAFTAMTAMRVQMALFARETLTPEQFKKMKARRAEHRKTKESGKSSWKGEHGGSMGTEKGEADESSSRHADDEGPGL